MTLPERVRKARLDAGMTQLELESRAGLSHRHVTAIEGGRRPEMSVGVLVKLSRALGVSADWLLGLDKRRK
jgi:transcriptional regulator with XRE-family HTH domain